MLYSLESGLQRHFEYHGIIKIIDTLEMYQPAAGATPDVMNVWQSKADDYSIVQCAMLYGLELGH